MNAPVQQTPPPMSSSGPPPMGSGSGPRPMARGPASAPPNVNEAEC